MVKSKCDIRTANDRLAQFPEIIRTLIWGYSGDREAFNQLTRGKDNCANASILPNWPISYLMPRRTRSFQHHSCFPATCDLRNTPPRRTPLRRHFKLIKEADQHLGTQAVQAKRASSTQRQMSIVHLAQCCTAIDEKIPPEQELCSSANYFLNGSLRGAPVWPIAPGRDQKETLSSPTLVLAKPPRRANKIRVILLSRRGRAESNSRQGLHRILKTCI
jgi:hypothetical protein